MGDEMEFTDLTSRLNGHIALLEGLQSGSLSDIRKIDGDLNKFLVEVNSGSINLESNEVIKLNALAQ